MTGRLLPVLLATLAATACQSVAPWERGELARAEMQWVVDAPGQRLRAQVYDSKEASSGGVGAAGGGCGCN